MQPAVQWIQPRLSIGHMHIFLIKSEFYSRNMAFWCALFIEQLNKSVGGGYQTGYCNTPVSQLTMPPVGFLRHMHTTTTVHEGLYKKNPRYIPCLNNSQKLRATFAFPVSQPISTLNTQTHASRGDSSTTTVSWWQVHQTSFLPWSSLNCDSQQTPGAFWNGNWYHLLKTRPDMDNNAYWLKKKQQTECI